MTKINPNDPAFPVVEQGTAFESVSTGLTIRAELAARAMQGICSSLNEKYASGGRIDRIDAMSFAQDAIRCADALIAELNKTEPATDTGKE